ncbi:mucin-5AC isoform X6 [Canis lupus familiaris]|uniref:mucin-5AC isoform X6 n=1 Tax=Canis lupus familiaris TaxID=9615 RepID=UPI0018F6AB79|nr:mucin-5AC isoform X6 [Canis lupus familiaris]
MGVSWRRLAPLWALVLTLACARGTGRAQDSSAEHGKSQVLLPGPQVPGGHSLHFLPPLRMAPVVRALNPAHNGRVCSTWGNFHYKTFDGDIFHFPGLCNYVLSAHCGAAYEDFNIQLRRGLESNATTVIRVTMKLDGMVIQLTKNAVLANGQLIQLPFSQSGVLIEHSSNSLKVVARLGLVFMWSQDDSLLLELDAKYANQTCGLCGDFNSEPVFNEFLSHGVKLTPIQFGNLQKMDGPTEQCQDPVPVPMMDCSPGSSICEEILSSRLFSGCSALVDASSYVQACRHDLCACEHANPSSCICHTLAEYSRQCAHAGGLPLDWRGPDLCPQTCPLNMQYRECGSPCADTCSNPEHSQLCEDHCMAGCFCPEGMVLDDIGQTGCIPASQCACVYNGATYAPGAVYSTDCTNCTCLRGQWSCQEVPCPGTCSVLGGAHFSTFDERRYTVHGDCSYVLVKPCNSSTFTVLAELRKCGLTDTETCLRSLTLSLGGGHTVITVKASGEVFVNQIYTQMPISAGNVTLFRPSTFFIIAQTNLGLQLDIQLVPIMQVFVRLGPELRGLTCGLCGNFNQNQADDFRALSGVVEGTAAAFANTWKTQATCPNVKNSFEDPCSLSVENEKYAQHWCSRLTDPHGPFAQCHTAVNPGTYYSNCMFDTCNCEKSEDCLCAALSSYVHACAANGVLLSGWRDSVCTKPMATCPKSLTYQYHIDTCQPTCRSRSHEDITCGINFVPVDGCTCPTGTFMDDTGKCVPPTSCPCYHGGSMVPNGESLHERGAICTCTQGMLTCIGGQVPTPVCTPPMVYLDCRNATPGATGAGCQKSCFTLDMDCYSSQCEPGCVCPDGLVSDGKGGCVAVTDCPCVHNEASYLPGQTIWVGCNTCTCKNRMWKCTDEPCLATCAVYGDGHYLTFDGRRYSFSGDCAYTLVQDHCGGNSTANATFRVVTENVPCGTTGVTCSKAIKLFLGSYELRLSGGSVEVIEKGAGQAAPYSIRQMGIYLVVDTEVGLVLLWDRKTSIFLKLSPEFKGRVCGLCGNFDDNAVNDFTTRSQSVVGSTLEFGNSWKFSPSCPDAPAPRDPCTANPYRKSWSQKQCSIINSATFAACHAHVEPAKYYEACVGDACACDSGGDCECFCTAVAAYAQACHDVGVCVSWRTPDICPLFCDYYNPEGQCEWHYQPCGVPCMRTCRNPSGRCLHDLHGLEGCYPKCPPEAPIFDEDQMQCVATCPTPPPPLPCRVQGKSYWPGSAVPSEENCQSCVCTESGVQCVYDAEACVCTYDGSHFHLGDVIYHTTDGTGGCISARCSVNGTIERKVYTCSSTTPAPPTTFSFSTPSLGVSSIHPPRTCHRSTKSTVHTNTPSSALSSTLVTASSPMSHKTSVQPHVTCGEECLWSPWLDVSHPGRGIDSGDFDTLENLRAHGYHVCSVPKEVECQAEGAPEVPLQVLGQHVECSPTVGLVCYNRNQTSGLCYNYQIRILCCFPGTCSTSSTPPPPPASTPTPSRITEMVPTSGVIRVTPVPTHNKPSPATVTATGTTTLSTTSKTHAPGTTTPTPGTTTLAPSTPTPLLVTSTIIPSTFTLALSTPLSVPVTTVTIPGTPTHVPGTTTTTTGTPTPTQSATTTTLGSPTTVKNTTFTLRSTPASTTPAPCLQNLCSWTHWLDGSYPEPGINGGDFDTFPNLRATGYKFCEKPSNVECRAAFFPNIPLDELGQDVICDKSVGLMCLNKNQFPPICYNYEIRIQCCELVDVCTSTTSPVTAENTHTTPRTTQTHTQLTSTTGIPLSPTQHSEVSSTQVHSSTSNVLSTNLVSVPTTINCQPRCTWTKWFDVDFPSPGPHGGDVESFSNIMRRGEKICRRPEYITQLECRAESHPEVSIDKLGQVVQCNLTKGLVCRNQDQKGNVGMCLNYEVRVLCCETPEGCPHTKTVTVSHTPSVSTSSLKETTTHLVTSHSTSVPTASPKSVSTTTSTSMPTTGRTSGPETSSTSVPTTAPTSVPTTSSTSVPPSSPTSVPKTSSTSGPTTGPTTVPTTSSTTVPTTGPTSVPTTSSTSVPPSSPTSVPEPSSTSGPTTGSTTVPTTATTSVPTTAPTSVPTTSSTSVPPSSPTSVPESSSTFGPTTGPTTVPTTSSTTVPTTGPTSVPTTSSTSVPPSSPTSVPEPSSTSGPTTGSTTVPTTATTSVPTTAPTSVPTTSSTSVPTSSPTTVPTTSSTSVPPSSPTSVPKTSSTSGPTTGPTTVPTTSSTSVPTTGPTTVPTTSSTTVPTTGPTSVPTKSSTSVPPSSPTFVPESSSTSGPTTGPTTVPTTSSTTVPTTSPTSVPTTSSTSVPPSSPTSVPEPSSTSVSTTAPRSVPATSSTPMSTTRPIPVPTTRSTSVPTTSPTSVSTVSTTSVPRSSSISVPITSPTSVPTTSPISVPKTTKTTVPKTSPTSMPTTSSTSVPATSPTSAPKTSSASVPTTSATTVPTTSLTSLPASSPTSLPKTTTMSAPTTSTIPVLTSETTHSPYVTVTCQPQCTWTKWFDVDFPSPGPHGGDAETFCNIKKRGEKICRRPEYIAQLECRAESHPEVSIDKLGQVVQCNVTKGLVCRNRDQKGNVGMCLNYEVRVLCCETPEGCPHTKTVTVSHTPSVSTSSLKETTTHLVTSHSTSVPTASPKSVSTTTSTSMPTTGRTSGPETSSTSVPTTAPTSVPTTSSTSVPPSSPTSVPKTSSTSGPTTATTLFPTTSSTTVPTTGPTTVPTTSSTTVPTTGPTSVPTTSSTSVPPSTSSPTSLPKTPHLLPTSTIPVLTSETTHSPYVTVTCQPQCTWTKWFDVDFPSPGPHGGDAETFCNIKKRGEKICRRPEYIAQLECRAESHPEVSIDKLGQVVQCNVTKGLVCRNRDQKGNVGMCLNYEVRVLCCETPEGCPHTKTVTVSHTPSVSTSSLKETTTHLVTSHSTSVPTASPKSVSTTTSTSMPTTGRTSGPETSSTSVPTTAPTSVPTTSSTSVPPSSPTSVPKTSSTSGPTTGPTTVPTTSSTTVPTTGPTSVPTTSSTSVPTTGPTTVPTTSSTTVPTTGPTSVPTTSSTSVPPSSPTSVPEPSSTSGPTTGSTTVPTTATTSVPTTAPTSVPTTSSTSVPTSSPTTVPTTSSTSVPPSSPTSVPKTSSTSGPTTGPTTVPTTSSTSVPTTGPTTVPTTSSTTVPTTGPTSVPTTSSTSVPPSSPTSVPESSSTSGPTTGPTTVPTTSSTTVPTTGPNSVPTTSSTSVPPSSPTSVPEPSSTSGPTTGSTTVPTTATTSVPTTAPTSVPTTSSTSVPTSSPTTVPTTSSTSVPPSSPTSVPKTSSTSGPTTGPTTVPTTSSTSVPTTGPTTVPTTSSTTVPTTGPTSVPTKSSTSVPPSSPTFVPESSSTSGPTTGPTTVPTTSSTTVPTTSPTSVPTTSSTSVPPSSPTSVPEPSSTSVSTTAPRSVPATSSTPMSTTRPIPVPTTRSTSVPTTSPTSVSTVSTTSVPRSSSISVPITSPTTVPTTSPKSVPETNSTSVPTTSPISVPKTTKTTVPKTSPTSMPTTSSTSVPATSPTSAPKTSSASVPTTSATTVPTTSLTSLPASSPTSLPKTTTMSAPTTSTIPVLTSETTHSPYVTVTCQPQCTWTKWFDVDFPSPGPHGGDSETFCNIKKRGEKICRRPEYIAQLECRAESHPEVSIDKLGQVVQCNVTKGLVCRNRDQKGNVGMCLNYEVRVLCCEPPEHCGHTSVTPHVTSSTNRSPPPEFTSVVSTVSFPSSVAPSTTTCYCSVSGKLYPAGSIIYQQTDLAGHCYYAMCSLDCQVVRWSDQSCSSSVPPPAPTTSPPGPSLSASVPVTMHGCPNAIPPRMKGETWPMPNCSQATCQGNGVITVHPRSCPQTQPPTCTNGFPPVKVTDHDDCCPNYQCQCVCSGWGDPHYITFDGTYYSFLDNCTYVLVQQIVPVYGHFRVLINNYFCGAEDGLSCPQSIIVEYQQARVVMTRKPILGVMTNEIIFNDQVVRPGFQKDGVSVSQIGIKMYVTIPKLGVQVMFSGLIFSVEVPFSKFANNTEGQCGTCSNDKRDECRLPGGVEVASCSAMSSHWRVTTPDQPYCYGPLPTPTAAWPTPSPSSCPPAPVCHLILSKVFGPCHAVIPPLAFYEGCVFDHCHKTDSNVMCSALELYASLCASRGVCIDWRSHTNHTCPFTCPADKVYQPCGPSKPSYCYGSDNTSLMALQDSGPITEGCFCPEGMKFFSRSSEVCVPIDCHKCLGPHGKPVEPGHSITVDCQWCTCENHTLTMSCQRQPCPLPPACPLPGFVPVPAAPQAGQCCPQYNCACDTSYCPKPVACPEGSRPILTYEEGACCPSQNCSWSVCNVNGTLYQPGSVVSSSLCETCRCEAPNGPHSDTVIISCETQICNTHCPVGFEYQPQSGQCCGLCVQQACVVNSSNNSTHLFYPGQSWPDPGNPCMTHECEKHQDGLVVVTTKKACPPLSCPEEQALPSKDGCCLSCPLHPPHTSSTCAVYHEQQVISQQGCSSPGPVHLAYCQGNCGDSSSRYSLETKAMKHTCQCCQELRVSLRNVTLHCADGSSWVFSYPQVEECGCVGQHCGSEESRPEQSGEEQSEEIERTGWRRRPRTTGSPSRLTRTRPRGSRPPSSGIQG